jgi:ABC-type transport system substrate-binding protein
MSRSKVPVGRWVAIVLALGLGVSTLAVTGGGAAVSAKIDKNATLRVGVPIEANGGVFFDPTGPERNSQNPSTRLWLDLLYDTMIRNTPDGKGEPGLATEWNAPDPNTVELTLREDVKFSDGTPFNADAVKASWDQLPENSNPVPNITAVTEVEVTGEFSVVIHLSDPVAQTLIDQELRNANFFAVTSPTADAAGHEGMEDNPIGAGPYILESYETGHIVLTKNPTYFDKKKQKVKTIEFIDTPVGASSVSALQTDTIDITWSIPPDSIETINSQPGLEVAALGGEGVYDLNLCPTSEVFATKEARQAVAFAVDRDSINEAALAGTGEPLVTPLGPDSPFFNEKLAKTYSYKPKKAKALLKQAGVEPGTVVSSIIPAQAPYPAIAEIVQDNLKDVGLELEITTSTNFAADAGPAKPDLMTVQLDPSLYTLALGGQTTVLNNCGFSNPELIQALADTADSSKSEAEVAEAWDTLQSIVVDEAVIVFLNRNAVLGANTDKVKGFDIINAPYGPQLNRISIEK